MTINKLTPVHTSGHTSVDAFESAFHESMAIFPDPAHSRGEERFIAISKTNQGRNVFVAFTLRQQGGETRIRPISARYMHPKEVDYYETAIAKTGD